MIRDITLGQYYNTKSLLHSLDPRVKLRGIIFYVIALFIANSYISYLFAGIFLFICIKISNVPFSFIVRGLKSLLLLLFISVVFNLFLTPGELIFSFWIFNITVEGLNLAIKMAMRLMFLVLFSSLLTLTTSPKQLTDGIEANLSFLKRFKVPVSDIALMMSISLRFIPILVDEVDKIMKAQMSRGASFDDKNIIKKAKSMIPLLVPIFISAFRRANDLALAMEARCYNDSDNSTKLNPLKHKSIDYKAYIVLILFLIIMIFIRDIKIYNS